MPGILAALTGIITAIAGLVVTLHQVGFFENREETTPPLLRKLKARIFTTQNIKPFKTPHQEFKPPQITAKYLKIKILSTYGDPHPNFLEAQAFGRIIE